MFVNPSDVKVVFGNRLAIARKMRGLSLQELADLTGNVVTKQAISKYEKGFMAPSGQVAIDLARQLRVPTDFLFTAPEVTVQLADVAYRKRARFSRAAQRAIETQTIDFLERYARLEQILRQSIDFKIVLQHSSIENGLHIERAAQEFRNALHLGDGPIFCVLEMLEETGCKVFEVEADDAFDGMSALALGNPVVVLNTGLSSVRKRFSALHEIAHVLLKFDPSLTEREIEGLCHRFAGAVLLPEYRMRSELSSLRECFSIHELVLLKGHWGISIKAILVRAHQLGILSKSAYVRALHAYSTRGYNLAEPGRYPVEEKPIRFEQLLLRAVAEDLLSLNDAASLSNRKLAEMRDLVDVMK